MKRLPAFILSFAVAIQSMVAVQAQRDIIKQITQPDGSTISVRLVGDERAHCYITTDEIPLLVDQNGFYCYATLSADGNVQPSTMIARDIDKRTIAETRYITSLDTHKIGNAIFTKALNARPTAIRRANASSGLGLFGEHFPYTGDVHALVILVQYSDVKFSMSNAGEYYNNFMNQVGFSEDGATGSVRDYFIASSMGKFTPTFDAYGPVTLSHNRAYYGENDYYGNDKLADEMVVEACRLLDNEIDFTKYDTDGDGYVDNVYIIYAGNGEATGGPANSIWPHQYELRYTNKTAKFDGKTVNCYGCCNEVITTGVAGIGTFCHEFGHVIGLPDLYSTTYNSAASLTPGSWSIMDYGSYNNNGRTPPIYTAFERNALGWLEPIELTGAASISLPNIQDSGKACIINTSSANEFFLLENRQQSGWDSYIPGHGMLIWHIDYDESVWTQNAVNNDMHHQYVDIEEANKMANNQDEKTMAGYAFPGTSLATSFTDDTTPSMKTWNGISLGLPIENIVEQNGVIYFDVCGGKADLSTPNISVNEVNAGGFTISWDTVENAISYLVSIYSDAEHSSVVPAYDNVEISELTFTTTRLDASQTYYISITPKRNSIIGDKPGYIEVTTGDFDFTLAVPKVAEASEVSQSSFIANWHPVENATDYLFTLKTISDIEPISNTANFGLGSTLKIPEGWTSSTTDYYISKNYYGESAPSLKFSNTGDYIETCLYDDNIMSMSFWIRLAGTSATNYINIEGFVIGPDNSEGEWIHLLKKENIKSSVGGETVSLSENDIPDGVRRIRITYQKLTSGNIALDDMTITTGGEAVSIVDGFDSLSVGNVTSYRLTNVDLINSTYLYSVIAKSNDGTLSLESDPMIVVYNSESSVEDFEIDRSDNVNVEYFNLQGIAVEQPSLPGIYIRREGNRVTKVLIK